MKCCNSGYQNLSEVNHFQNSKISEAIRRYQKPTEVSRIVQKLSVHATQDASHAISSDDMIVDCANCFNTIQ